MGSQSRSRPNEEVDYGETPLPATISNRMGPPGVFAKNLRVLTAIRGLKATTACRAIQQMLEEHGKSQLRAASGRTKKTVAESIAHIKQNPVDPKWYRRLMQRGVTRSNKRTWRHMNAIAVFFRVTYEDLWDEELSNRLNIQAQSKGEVPKAAEIYSQKLTELFERGDGKYDYLKFLIDSLHGELLFGRGVKK